MIQYCFVLFFLFTSLVTSAFSLDGSQITLTCPQRGRVEVILHRYEHTQESWGKDQFETGGGYSPKGALLIFKFANLDSLFFNKNNGIYYFWYADKNLFVQCELMSIKTTHPANVPYYKE
ncbi:hypothetical protein ACHFJ3_07365 [Klebsiella pneumoniae]|uniref:hypothetical protein n=1 Tax=Klebsiella pneumoniae TaxID=573 RepID=UPI0010332C46|nr:hypothetical protein [Klebsiella pneumoniae]MDQ5647776.1 hypothetical protein [Klebsiella pneumoniae]